MEEISRLNDLRHAQLNHDVRKPLVPLNTLYFSTSEITDQLDLMTVDHLESVKLCSSMTLKTNAIEPLEKLAQLQTHLAKGTDIIISCPTYGSAQNMAIMLKCEMSENCQNNLIHCLEEPSTGTVKIISAPFSESCLLKPLKAIISLKFFDRDSKPKTKHLAKEIAAPSEHHTFAPGDLVVHSNHGIGRFLGLHTISHRNIDSEFCMIEFQNNDKIHLPVTDLSVISPYKPADQQHAHPLAKLGSKKWQHTQIKAIKKMLDTASLLLATAAKRQSLNRPPYRIDRDRFDNFLNEFAFDDTIDQEKTTQDMLIDLTQQAHPMDRLICGDVGFGKTELSMRAAFLVAHAGYQVAILAPTTILARQHFTRYTDRFSKEPFLIVLLTGTITSKKEKEKLTWIENHKADIIIGTHSILSSKICYKKLALVIIDEEQRFGVRQKEVLKTNCPHVDMLALSATPIPRTLNLTMTSLRDISLIASPPANRHAILTFTCDLDDEASMKEAILRETNRGGQVYFCYNNIQKLATMKLRIKQWFPRLNVDIAHGQMSRNSLSAAMQAFYDFNTDVLICSSIIEAGLDHSNANTIIIYRADLFGLSQLHQLRGRIGRSSHLGYAYLFIPQKDYMNNKSIMRIEAIIRHQKIGSGFALALEDLEIRGAGDLLGASQSGHIDDIGFVRYMDLLNKTVKWLKKHPDSICDPQEIAKHSDFICHYPLSAVIPDTYISDTLLRLSWYRKISRAHHDSIIQEISIQLIDRYGPMPRSVKALLDMRNLKTDAVKIGITKIQIRDTQSRITFTHIPNSIRTTIIKLLQENPANIQLSPPSIFILNHIGSKHCQDPLLAIHDFVKSLIENL